MNNTDTKKQENEQRLNEENDNDNEVDEETLDVRSAEIDNLFNILLKLKNVLSFTSNTKVIQDKSALLNYINAKYTFNEVSNFKGKNLCDSNVGNLAMKCKKYDKAIFHLLEAIKENKKDTNLNSEDNESILEFKTGERRKSKQSKGAPLNEEDKSEAKALINKNEIYKTIFLGKLIYKLRKQVPQVTLLLQKVLQFLEKNYELTGIL
jgi:tetratricopeptide (TPR) repeat protein